MKKIICWIGLHNNTPCFDDFDNWYRKWCGKIATDWDAIKFILIGVILVLIVKRILV